MADGDILRLGILKPYVNVYRQICEGGGSVDEWVYKAACGLKTFLEKYNEEPQILINRSASYLEFLIDKGSPLSSHEMIALDKEISKQQMYLRGNKKGMDLAARAVRDVANNLEHGACTDDIRTRILYQFVCLVYKATFVTPIDAARKHHDNIDREVVKECIRAIEPGIEKHINHFVKQLCNLDRKSGLRILPGQKPKVDLDTEFE